MLQKIFEQTKEIFRDANKNFLSSVIFKIIGVEYDNITKRAVFKIKARRISSVILVSTVDIINNDRYLVGMSEADRKSVFEQYQIELKQPTAFLDSVSLFPKESDHQYLIKIFLVLENKMISKTASEILNDSDLMLALSQYDTSRIAKIFAIEKSPCEEHFFNAHANVRYLK